MMSSQHFEILQARTSADFATVRELFLEYAASIGVNLEYQGFSAEVAALPGQYAPPTGELLVAKLGGAVAGCVALRSLKESTLEMKRLYVRPSFRGMKLGKRLAEAAIEVARVNHYKELRLDTLATMAPAQALYSAMGFVEIPPYGKAFLPGTKFYSLSLPA